MAAVSTCIWRQCLSGAAFILISLSPLAAAPLTAAQLQISWASNSETDLENYRLHYGTISGSYDAVLSVGFQSSVQVTGLVPGQGYYFAVSAVDEAGNEGPLSAEVLARIPTSLDPIPVVKSVFELASYSMYAIQSQGSYLLISGSNFRDGADVSLGLGVNVGDVTLTASGNLLAWIEVETDAALGPRILRVKNPDQGVGSRSETISIVKLPDVSGNCVVDTLDLNALARAWNESIGEASYSSESDLDGDEYVGPEDLTIFVKFLGRTITGCP